MAKQVAPSLLHQAAGRGLFQPVDYAIKFQSLGVIVDDPAHGRWSDR